MNAKVALLSCNGYDPQALYNTIKRALELIGGLSLFINKGECVLLKPNLLGRRYPESGVNTHPEFLRAVIKLLKDINAVPIVGDSPGGCVKTEEVYEISGIKKICREEDVELVKFDEIKEIDQIPIARKALEADKIISIPKLKTHCLTVLTGAIKNNFGIVPGMFKSECHRLNPQIGDFSRLLVDIFSFSIPCLSIMDAVSAMEGEGPSAGTVRNLGLIIVSSDSVALDSVASSVVGVNPLDVPTTKEAYKRGLGEADMGRIEIIGESLEKIKVKNFKLSKTAILNHMPRFLLDFLTKLIQFKPKINFKKCRKCNFCAGSCPVNAIKNRDSDHFYIDYHRCILCLCCHEICPENAIFVNMGFLVKAMQAFRKLSLRSGKK